MAQEWALQQQLLGLLPLGEGELTQILSYAGTLQIQEANIYLNDLLGDSPEALRFITTYNESRAAPSGEEGYPAEKGGKHMPSSNIMASTADMAGSDVKSAPLDEKKAINQRPTSQSNQPPSYAPPSMPPPTASRARARNHTNQVIEAGKVRARDEVRSL